MPVIELTAYPGKILGPIAKVLGGIMSGIYDIIYNVSGGRIDSIPLAIIIMTLLIYMCLLPLTIKQQKFSKLSQKMQPELQAIQAKYKNRKDQESMMAMNQESQLVYEKYGVSAMGSCVQMLIQMPILFALYRVFYNIPAYVGSIKSSYTALAEGIYKTDKFADGLSALMKGYNTVTSSGLNSENVVDMIGNAAGKSDKLNYIIDVLYKLPSAAWVNDTADKANTLVSHFNGLEDKISGALERMNHFNYFMGLNISDTPFSIIKESVGNHWGLVIIAALIPILSYLSQLVNIKLMPTAGSNNPDDAMARQMKSMNTIMPLFSLFLCFITPVGLGIYWVASSLVRAVQQFFINRHMDKIDLDEMIKKNQEKAKKKREKLGISEEKMRQAAQINTRSIASKANTNVSSVGEKTEFQKNDQMKPKPGSLAAKANLVQDFNQRNNH